ncbi:MAG: ankyrin repeat domain-containing protein [Gemmatimonadaceae bacterium]|nr:ankyrin repeat domain-containing protein [Gemmatimonadaceae bacterium]
MTTSTNESDTPFAQASRAIVDGDIETLRTLLVAHPALIHERSSRPHHSTLLHYVAANGIEDEDQRTPANILEIAALLLDRGAEVDATSDAYGGGSTVLGLVATSAHPRARGVQIALIDLLLARGASLAGEETLPRLVQWALANGCPEAAVALASRGAHLPTLYAAAGVGDRSSVIARFNDASSGAREAALIVAAQQGHHDIVAYLLDHGVDVAASNGMTALHMASGWCHLELMQFLIDRGAPLEARNEYDGTVLSSTLWFAYHVVDQEFRRRDYHAALSLLVAAGARVDVYPELLADIEGVRLRASAQRAT